METTAAHTNATDQLLRSASFDAADWPAFVVGIETAVDLFGRMLGKLVNCELTVEIDEITSGRAGALIDESRPLVTNLVRAENWEADLLAGVTRQAALQIVELLFGGEITSGDDAPQRGCTAIELATVGLVFRHLAAVLQSSFAAIADPGTKPGTCKDESMLEELGGPDTPVVLVRMSCRAMEQRIDLFLAVAQQTLTFVGDALQAVPAEPAEQGDPAWSEHFDRQLRRADVKITAVMDCGSMTLDEVSRWRTGQVLELDTKQDSLIKVDCNGQALLWCQLGQSDGAFMLRIEQFADAEQDLMDELLGTNAAGR